MIDDIVEALIEIGMDALNPVQPECVDSARLKQHYGDRISAWGGVGAPTHLLEPEVPYENIEALVRVVRQYDRY